MFFISSSMVNFVPLVNSLMGPNKVEIGRGKVWARRGVGEAVSSQTDLIVSTVLVVV